MQFSRTSLGVQCDHCGASCADGQIQLADKIFCCEGCKSVYQILSSPDLCTYYTLQAHPGRKPSENPRSNKFAYLDAPDIARKVIQFTDGQQTHVTFFLPQIHCSSCLWLLEHLQRLDRGIFTSKVSFAKKEVFITFDEHLTSLRQIVELLARIGYEPYLQEGQLNNKSLPEQQRSHWIKIGLAGFCFSNIMMLSLPEYFSGPEGIEPQIAQFLTGVKILLSIPVITYAAGGFFVRAWQGLRERYLNIDAPIALALAITFGRSMYEILSGTGSGYLDSLSGIVFFMLIGRWLQDRTYQAISFDREFKSFFPIAVEVNRSGQTMQVPIEELKLRDRIVIHHGELVPVDAVLTAGEAQIDYSFVTGESLPVVIEEGGLVYAGGKQTGGRIELRVMKEASQSYLTQLWNKSTTTSEKRHGHTLVDSLSRYFTLIVFAICVGTAVYWWQAGQPVLLWNAVTAILLVACPCALLLSANFTYGNLLRILSLNKFYVRHAHVLELLSRINTIVFDKTGTLTHKSSMKVRYEGANLEPAVKDMLAQLFMHSNHPLSQAILHFLQTTPDSAAEHFKMSPGLGMEGWVNEHYIRIGSPQFLGMPATSQDASEVCCSVDQRYLGTFFIESVYRTGLSDMFTRLKKRYTLAILSGDLARDRSKLEKEFGLDGDILFEQKPEDKINYIARMQQNPQSRILMVGDGLNDGPALQQSHVGIAVSESDNAFTPTSDGIITASHVARLDSLLMYIRAGRKIILFSFAISILYNLTGLYFAVQGTLFPLLAAILMPLSTITIILVTYGLTGLLARQYGLQLNHPST